jgi:hypothetical protein
MMFPVPSFLQVEGQRLRSNYIVNMWSTVHIACPQIDTTVLRGTVLLEPLLKKDSEALDEVTCLMGVKLQAVNRNKILST